MRDKHGIPILVTKTKAAVVEEETSDKFFTYPTYEYYINKRGVKTVRPGAFGKDPKKVKIRIY